MSVRLYDKGISYGVRLSIKLRRRPMMVGFGFSMTAVFTRDMPFNDCSCRGHWNAGRFEIGSDC